jgi:hypothetical protein
MTINSVNHETAWPHRVIKISMKLMLLASMNAVWCSHAKSFIEQFNPASMIDIHHAWLCDLLVWI